MTNMLPSALHSASRRCRCRQANGRIDRTAEGAARRQEARLVELITHRVPAGVDDAAKVKASYLAAVAHGTEKCPLISRERATELLGTMLGGYNISPLVDCWTTPRWARWPAPA